MTYPVSLLIELAADRSVTLTIAGLASFVFIAAIITGAAGRIALFFDQRR
jgi:hypothetical protein